MTLVDKLIPFYVWFLFGFAILSVIMGIANFGMVAITLMTVKGLYVPTWAIVLVAGLVISLCIIIGYTFEKYSIWDRITHHQNEKNNPQLRIIMKDLQDIKKILEEKK